jgi:hypothetical protein
MRKVFQVDVTRNQTNSSSSYWKLSVVDAPGLDCEIKSQPMAESEARALLSIYYDMDPEEFDVDVRFLARPAGAEGPAQ